MHPRMIYGVTALLLVAGSTLAVAKIQSPFGPIASVSGVPAIAGKPEEFDCTLCHSGAPNTAEGSVEILGVPATYEAGTIYPITVRLTTEATAAAANRRWGFQITAVRKSDGEGIGTFLLPDADTLQIVSGSDDYATRSYVEHKFLGTRPGQGGSAEWTFQWQAPATVTDSVYFFCAGNAGDGAFDTENDFIFTTSDSTVPATPAGAPLANVGQPTLRVGPNPSRGQVGVDFALAVSGRFDLSVLDLQGRVLRRLAAGDRGAGPGRVVWDGRADAGGTVRSGTYFVRMATEREGTTSRKVTIER
jgi:hypothetical protein